MEGFRERGVRALARTVLGDTSSCLCGTQEGDSPGELGLLVRNWEVDLSVWGRMGAVLGAGGTRAEGNRAGTP